MLEVEGNDDLMGRQDDGSSGEELNEVGTFPQLNSIPRFSRNFIRDFPTAFLFNSLHFYLLPPFIVPLLVSSSSFLSLSLSLSYSLPIRSSSPSTSNLNSRLPPSLSTRTGFVPFNH